jgi:DNA-binding NarL/FixJ family response regulator
MGPETAMGQEASMRDDRVAGDEGASGSPRLLNVFVMSHHMVVRAGLTMFICPEQDLDLVGESGADSSALPLIQACAPDIIILDVDDSEPDLIASVGRTVPSARLLLLTCARSAGRHQGLVGKAAAGLLLKEAPAQVVVKELRRCARSPSVDRAQSSAIVLTMRPELHQRRIARLSEGERDLVRLIGEGLRNGQIAVRLGLSEKTVRNRLSSLFDKLGVNDRLSLAVYAFEHGLLHQPT